VRKLTPSAAGTPFWAPATRGAHFLREALSPSIGHFEQTVAATPSTSGMREFVVDKSGSVNRNRIFNRSVDGSSEVALRFSPAFPERL
jgi:hypothetical protein